MCGIAGLWSGSGGGGEGELAALALAMADRLAHRGPEDRGAWADPAAGVALGHRRLAIIDLSPAGRQPMPSADGRLVITFNGEIYNFAELRAELDREAAVAWRGHCDTEVLLEAAARWGLEATLRKCVGMFALALWDRERNRLVLARDRLGVKPLYYGWQGDTFFFASELKALAAHPGFRPRLSREALALFLRHGYIPAPYCIYEGVFKLPAGSILTVEGPRPGDRAVSHSFWSLEEVARRGLENPFAGPPEEAVERLEALLLDAVRLRLVADVPLGAFLSGGIDSSLVVALMQSLCPRPVKTFTIGFREEHFDEASHAKRVADSLGTDHTALYLTWDEARRVIPELPGLFDEPFADPSQIPTYLVSRLARREVTVSLSGDGGDELFAGYQTYAWMRSLSQGPGRFPRPARLCLAGLLRLLPATVWESLLPGREVGQRLHRLAEVLSARDQEEMYLRLISHWREPERLVGMAEPPTHFTSPRPGPVSEQILTRIMFLDGVTYLPDDILTKLDRASMAVALEGRVPLLDHRVVEFSWSLPLSLKVREGKPKWPLRQVLFRHVPHALVERPKHGFAVPLGEWLRGPLRPWAEEHLSPARLREEGVLAPDLVARRWAEHLAGGRNWQYSLWNVLMFQLWHQANPC